MAWIYLYNFPSLYEHTIHNEGIVMNQKKGEEEKKRGGKKKKKERKDFAVAKRRIYI